MSALPSDRRLPDSVITKLTPYADGCALYGRPVEDMDKEELIAMIGFLIKEIKRWY